MPWARENGYAQSRNGGSWCQANFDFFTIGGPIVKGPSERIETARVAHQLTRSLAENDSQKVALALQEILKRQDLSAIARTTGIRRDVLHKSLGAAANPSLSRILILLKALDIRLIAISSDQIDKIPESNYSRHRITEKTRPKKKLDLPPDVARAFIKDMREYFREKHPIRRDEIARRQLVALRDYNPSSVKELLVPDIYEMFEKIKDGA
jgi:probable addiction module antidote protein